MKKKFFIISILLFFAFGCEQIEREERQQKELFALSVGDKFIYQNYDRISIARMDRDVAVYQYNFGVTGIMYYSTTRKDSIIYQIRRSRR